MHQEAGLPRAQLGEISENYFAQIDIRGAENPELSDCAVGLDSLSTRVSGGWHFVQVAWRQLDEYFL